jgi:hypothetical protein
MTTRRFLMLYLGAVVVVGATGASAYQALLRLHATTPATPAASAVVAQADTPSAPAIATPASEPAQAASLPKLRPPLAAASKPLPPHRKRVVVAHAPAHRPSPPDSPWAYPPPPPPPGSGYYAYPARYPYPDYYPYYPRYGYYRSF